MPQQARNADLIALLEPDFLRKNAALPLPEITTPATPASGTGLIYMGGDSWPRVKQDDGKVLPLSVAEISFPLSSFYLTGAAFTVNTGNPVLVFRDAATDTIDASFFLPTGWGGRNTVVDMVTLSLAATGNTFWRLEFYAGNSSNGAWNPNGSGLSYTLAASNSIRFWSWTPFVPPNIADPMYCRLHIYREGTNVADTMLASEYLLAIRMRTI